MADEAATRECTGLKIVRRRSIRAALGIGNSLREAVEISIENRVLCRLAGMVDLFDSGGHAPKTALDLALYEHVRAVWRGAKQLVQPMDLGGKHPHRRLDAFVGYVVEVRGNGQFSDRRRRFHTRCPDHHGDCQRNDRNRSRDDSFGAHAGSNMQEPCRSNSAALQKGSRVHSLFSLLWTTDFASEAEVPTVTQCRIPCSIGSSSGRSPFLIVIGPT